MKRLVLLLSIALFAGSTIQAYSLKAHMSYAIFKTPDGVPYVETYLTIKGSSVKCMLQENGMFRGIVDVQIIFRKNDSIVNFDKYELAGLEVKDTILEKKNFLDIQRYALPPGNYELELSLKDRASNANPLISVVAFSIHFPDSEMAFSDIELLQSYEKSTDTSVVSKNGYQLIPYIFNFFPEWVSNLSFYAELYGSNTVQGTDYLLNYYIRPYEVEKKIDRYFYRKKKKADQVNVLLKSIDISQLPSGNYLLVLESRNRENQLMASKEIFFQRNNPAVSFDSTHINKLDAGNTFVSAITDRDTLVRYINYTFPISTQTERVYIESQLKTADLVSLQKYFLNFWMERNQLLPEDMWNDYHQRVKQANHNYKTASRLEGYQSDRGRVYLQYGQPNVVSESHNEPAAYPYEIWHYYNLGNQTDVRFVFYTKEIATNDFHLLHSTAKGELHNYRWETYIYSRTWDPGNLDATTIPDTWGSNATDYYLRPR
jgi:GWxTD domain-containing protein